MTIWTVYVNNEPEYASANYADAASRYNQLDRAGVGNVELRGAKEDGTPVFKFAGILS